MEARSADFRGHREAVRQGLLAAKVCDSGCKVQQWDFGQGVLRGQMGKELGPRTDEVEHKGDRGRIAGPVARFDRIRQDTAGRIDGDIDGEIIGGESQREALFQATIVDVCF